MLSNNNLKKSQKLPEEINKILAAKIRLIRKKQKISQQLLSKKSGVSYGSVKRFEQSGEISLISLTKIAIALDINLGLENLFEDKLLSIEEMTSEQN